MIPYIGITGFMSATEVSKALQLFVLGGKRSLMVGVLASHKSLRNIPMKPIRARQTPNPADLPQIFPEDGRTINLVHYGAHRGQEESLLEDMFKIHQLAGRNLHGLQLNAVWPPTWMLIEYRKSVGASPDIVLQVGAEAMAQCENNPKIIADKLQNYLGLINYILIDASGGLGKPLDTEKSRNILSEITSRSWKLGLGVAGGLGPDTLDLIAPLVQEFPNLNIDAQGKLRDEANNLNIDACEKYLTEALKLFG